MGADTSTRTMKSGGASPAGGGRVDAGHEPGVTHQTAATDPILQKQHGRPWSGQGKADQVQQPQQLGRRVGDTGPAVAA